MKQYVRQFSNLHKHLDDTLNDYLKEHPNYSIDKITVLGQAMDKDDRILVVFNVGEKPSHTIASGEYSVLEKGYKTEKLL